MDPSMVAITLLFAFVCFTLGQFKQFSTNCAVCLEVEHK